MYPAYPLQLDSAQERYLLDTLKDWSIAHGLAVRPPPTWMKQGQDEAGALATTAPVTLFPSLFPRSCFDQAKAVATAYNELYSAIASDEAWLAPIVEELIAIDDFMDGLWKIHLRVKEQGYAQSLALGLFRSDYMVHVSADGEKPTTSVKQVEFNTIASSFGGLSRQVSGLHKHLQRTGAYPESALTIIKDDALQLSESVPLLAAGMAKAHQAYGSSQIGLPTCVLFIVQDRERNVFDQRHVEYALRDAHNVPVHRLVFDQVLQETRLDEQRRLIWTPPHSPHKPFEVSVVYFRAGYAPSEYTTQQHWDGRLQIEQSTAIKCPTILTQLAGTKKVQQVLATPHSPYLAQFLPNERSAAAVLDTFAPIYPLDDSEAGKEARKLATNPDTAVRYVLKPQREGGGNNTYRKAIPDFLSSLPQTHWPAYILMEMIEPPAQNNVIFRNGEIQSGGVICELGVYGACLWDSQLDGRRRILENFEAGYLLRTKGDQSEEGGVAAGFGSVDSPCLIDL